MSATSIGALVERFDQLVAEAIKGGHETALKLTRHIEANLPALRMGAVDSTGVPLQERILAIFSHDRWRFRTEGLLDEILVNDATTRNLVHSFTQHRIEKLRTLAEAMSERSDEDDLRDHLVFWFVETKSEWYQLNSRINYQVRNGRDPDKGLMAMCNMSSRLMGELETLFKASEIEVLTDYVTSPLPNAEKLDKSRTTAA